MIVCFHVNDIIRTDHKSVAAFVQNDFATRDRIGNKSRSRLKTFRGHARPVIKCRANDIDNDLTATRLK